MILPPAPSTASVLLCAEFLRTLNDFPRGMPSNEAVPILAAMLDAHVAKERAPLVEALALIADRGVSVRVFGTTDMNGVGCANTARDALAKLEASP